MTIREAQKQVRALGMTLTHKNGEFRVNYRNGREDTAYYTDDIHDAVATAKHMARWAGAPAGVIPGRTDRALSGPRPYPHDEYSGNPGLSRKDYIRAAAIVREMRDNGPGDAKTRGVFAQWLERELISWFKSDNPAFDPQRFESAVGHRPPRNPAKRKPPAEAFARAARAVRSFLTNESAKRAEIADEFDADGIPEWADSVRAESAILSWLAVNSPWGAWNENPGVGREFEFHGTYKSKGAAQKKERTVPGSFIRPIKRDNRTYYEVLTRRNPGDIHIDIGSHNADRDAYAGNPPLLIATNPATLIGKDVHKIYYVHATEGQRVHEFESRGAKLYGLPDGSLHIAHPSVRLWGEE